MTDRPADPGSPGTVEGLTGTTALVTGASRGFGRAIATALSGVGAHVVGVARDQTRLDDLRDELGDTLTPVVAEVTDPDVAARLIDEHRPRTLVLNAGATPLLRPLHHQTWETFSRNWEVDVQQVFHWVREAMLHPLLPGSTVIAVSSGAAINGSPLSGGYAGAKATITFMTSYAAAESKREGLGITFASVLPQLTPATQLGASGVAAYAEHQGVDLDSFLQGFGPTLTREHVGTAIVDPAAGRHLHRDSYLLTPTGLAPLS
ncbi:SDR family oxidoreductase [Pseudonocardia xinjiangensis]|uniref:SDR family oxidoreductase n=1 Tax=Pseudonocardia xinjiangensis TaxID=75289 RepID=UPI003D9101AE